jgi:hypothetical protein
MYGWALILAIGLVIAGTISWGRFVLAFAAAGGIVVLLTLAPSLRRSAAEPEEQPILPS